MSKYELLIINIDERYEVWLLEYKVPQQLTSLSTSIDENIVISKMISEMNKKKININSPNFNFVNFRFSVFISNLCITNQKPKR